MAFDLEIRVDFTVIFFSYKIFAGHIEHRTALFAHEMVMRLNVCVKPVACALADAEDNPHVRKKI